MPARERLLKYIMDMRLISWNVQRVRLVNGLPEPVAVRTLHYLLPIYCVCKAQLTKLPSTGQQKVPLRRDSEEPRNFILLRGAGAPWCQLHPTPAEQRASGCSVVRMRIHPPCVFISSSPKYETPSHAPQLLRAVSRWIVNAPFLRLLR